MEFVEKRMGVVYPTSILPKLLQKHDTAWSISIQAALVLPHLNSSVPFSAIHCFFSGYDPADDPVQSVGVINDLIDPSGLQPASPVLPKKSGNIQIGKDISPVYSMCAQVLFKPV